MLSRQRMSCYNSTAPSSPPMSVMVTGVDRALLMVSWQPPRAIDHNGEITGYQINYTRVGFSNTMTMNFNSETRQGTLSGLVAFVEYSVRIAAVNSAGTGTFSNATIERSGQDGELDV